MKAPMAVLCASVVLSAQPAEIGTWEESTPESQGMESTELVKLLGYINQQGKALDSLLIIRHGRLILELDYPPYTRDKEHIVNSVTKNFISALVGIAIDQGYVHGDRSTLLDYFPEVADASKYPGKASIQIRDLLTMNSGIDWPQYGPNNVSDEMGRSPNWVEFILRRPMAAKPGSQSNYSNGDAHLLSAIIQRATGEDSLEFGWKHLFQPLGIPRPKWFRDPQGINIGSATIYLPPREMAKLGYLYLHDGTWGGKQIVPAEWVRASLERHTGIQISAGLVDYGYYWWLYPQLGMSEAWGGAGQRIAIFRDLDMVTVMTADISDDAPVTTFSSELYRRILRAARTQSALPENVRSQEELGELVRSAAEARPRPERAPWPIATAGVLALFGITWLVLRQRRSAGEVRVR
jgi:CubicO group peptidase (beta-lactamase class C family)